MSEFNSDEVDWQNVEENLRTAEAALQRAEDEVNNGFEQPERTLSQSASQASSIEHKINELIKSITNSSSYLRNGSLEYIPE